MTYQGRASNIKDLIMRNSSSYRLIKISMCMALILLVALGVSSATVLAVPMQPNQVFGDVAIGTSDVPDGIEVSAKIGGVAYDTTITLDGKYGYDPLFKVPADDPATDDKEGGVDGDTVVLCVGGVEAGSTSFTNGGSVNVDLTVSALPAPGQPGAITKANADSEVLPAFTWTAPAQAPGLVDYYDVKIDGEYTNIGNVTTYTAPTALSEGSYTFQVRAVDKLDNAGAVGSLVFVVDLTPPDVTIQEYIPDPTSDTTPRLVGTATDVTTAIAKVECKIDDGSWNEAVFTADENDAKNGIYTFTTYALIDGNHTAYVRATDAAGNVTPEVGYASDQFEVDTGAPAVSINPLTPDPYNFHTPTFTGEAMDDDIAIASVEYKVDDLEWMPAQATDGTFNELIEDYTFITPTLLEGAHTVYIRATDAADNTTAEVNYASDSFTISTAVVKITIENEEPPEIDAVEEADTEVSFKETGAVSGTIVVTKYDEEPAIASVQFASEEDDGGTGMTPVKFVDVYVEGFTTGTATVTIHYTDAEVEGLAEDGLKIFYWYGGLWRLADNIDVDTDANTILADIPVSALTGTPIGIGGSPPSSAIPLSLWVLVIVVGIVIMGLLLYFLVIKNRLNDDAPTGMNMEAIP